MSLQTAFAVLSQLLFLVLAVLAVQRALRTRRGADVDVAFFLTGCFLTVSPQSLTFLQPSLPGTGLTLTAAMLLVLPSVALRVVQHFTPVHRTYQQALAGLGAVLLVVVVLTELPRPLPVLFLLQGYFAAGMGLAAWRFARRARTVRGARRRRKQMAALGLVLLVATLALRSLAARAPGWNEVWAGAEAAAGFGAATSFLLSFAAPLFLRRGWNAPELRRFNTSLATMEWSDLPDLARALEAAVVDTVSVDGSLVSLWNESEGRLRAPSRAAPVVSPGRANSSNASDVFQRQRPLFVDDMVRSHPENRDVYEAMGMHSAALAPITLGERRYGVLTAYSSEPPLFADDDLEIVIAVAEQIALLLRITELQRGVTEMEARRSLLMLQEDFLASAAHDLRTPLTAAVGIAQVLQRRVRRAPEQPPDPALVDSLVHETQRLWRLTDDLLNVIREGDSSFVGEVEETDLGALVADVIGATAAVRDRVEVSAPSVLVAVDAPRIRQVLQNLLDNAVKFSPPGSPITVSVTSKSESVTLSVRDEGIGIAEADLPWIFERFTRGTVAEGVPGTGLGLYICRRIVEGHNGRIWAESGGGPGSTFHVLLPAVPAEVPAQPSAEPPPVSASV